MQARRGTKGLELLAVADLTEVPVSRARLRGLGPQTRIVIRTELRHAADQGARVSRGAPAGRRLRAVPRGRRRADFHDRQHATPDEHV